MTFDYSCNKKFLLLSVSDKNNWDFDANIYDPIKSIFSNVIKFEDYRKRCNDIGTKNFQSEIIELVKKERPHYVLFPASSYEILEKTFETIRAEEIIVIGWFFDDGVRFHNYSKYWIPFVDYFLTGDKESVQKYNSIGARSFFVPIACNEKIYVKKNVDISYEVSFVGRNIANREELLAEIERRNIEVNTFGFHGNHVITFDEMINVFSSSKINLNFTRSYADSSIKQLKARIFEVPMCGGFLLTEYVEGLEEYFEINKEIVCFNTVGEMVDKIRYYLTYEDERDAIARSGWNRAHCDHTWKKRLGVVFEKIERDIVSNGPPAVSQIQLPLPENLQRNRFLYHYNLAKESFHKGRIDICADELNLSLKFDQKSKRTRMLLVICKLPKILCLTIFYAYDKLDSVFIKIRNKLRIRSRLNAVRRAVHL